MLECTGLVDRIEVQRSRPVASKIRTAYDREVKLIRLIIAAGSVILLLAVSSLALSCELSCAFASFQMDCHSSQAPEKDSTPGAGPVAIAVPMAMDSMNGMDMSAMSETDGAQNSASIGASREAGRHDVFAEMGVCERQTCAPGPAEVSQVIRSIAVSFHAIPVTAISSLESLAIQTVTHDTGAGLRLGAPPSEIVLSKTLRI